MTALWVFITTVVVGVALIQLWEAWGDSSWDLMGGAREYTFVDAFARVLAQAWTDTRAFLLVLYVLLWSSLIFLTLWPVTGSPALVPVFLVLAGVHSAGRAVMFLYLPFQKKAEAQRHEAEKVERTKAAQASEVAAKLAVQQAAERAAAERILAEDREHSDVMRRVAALSRQLAARPVPSRDDFEDELRRRMTPGPGQ